METERILTPLLDLVVSYWPLMTSPSRGLITSRNLLFQGVLIDASALPGLRGCNIITIIRQYHGFFFDSSKQSRLDIVGEWKISADKSALVVIKAEKMDAEKMDHVKESISKRIERFTIVVDDKKLRVKGKQFPYLTVSESPDEVIIEAVAEGQKITLTFATYDAESITIKSSDTKDMDYYVWDKTRSQ
jgi:hypothetical protein